MVTSILCLLDDQNINVAAFVIDADVVVCIEEMTMTIEPGYVQITGDNICKRVPEDGEPRRPVKLMVVRWVMTYRSALFCVTSWVVVNDVLLQRQCQCDG